MNILITGASGMIGRGLISYLSKLSDYNVHASTRHPINEYASRLKNVNYIQVDPLSEKTDWTKALNNIDVIIHTAAKVHVMNQQAAQDIEQFRQVNVEGTLQLAKQAASAGIKHLIFLSSIKVNGEKTKPGKKFTASDVPAPEDAYGQSKYEAEQTLLRLGKETDMAITIIRPPLVYGRGVKANFLKMLTWLNRAIPLPLASIKNKRSLVSLDNLTDLIKTCIDHPNAKNNTLLVSDDFDLSTPALLSLAATALGKSAKLMPFPPRLLYYLAAILGKQATINRLTESLQIDITDTKNLLNWHPPFTVEQSLAKTAKAFHADTET